MRSSAVALALVLSLGVAGCAGDEPQPGTLDPLPSASPSAVGASPIPVPSAALSADAFGASAFARHYLALVDAAFEAGDPSAVIAVSDPGCGGCNSFIDGIRQDSPEGERYEGGTFDVRFAEAPPVADGDVVVDLQYVVTELKVYGPDGALLRTKPATAPTLAQMRLNRRGSGWVVRGFRNVEAAS